jgi:hypothetical protein
LVPSDRSVALLRKRLEAKLGELQQQRCAVVQGQQQAAACTAAAAALIENRISLLRQALEEQKRMLQSSYSSDEALALQQLQQVSTLRYLQHKFGKLMQL